MTDLRVPIRGLLGALLVVTTPFAAGAQDRIEPAPAIGVIQSVDPVSGEVSRWVTENPLPAEILRVQVELARAGYDPGVRSGALDGRTRAALRDFQTARGLLICGCLTYETIIALGIRPAVTDLVNRQGPFDGYAGSPGTEHGVVVQGYRDVIFVVPVAPPFRHPHRRHGKRLPGVVVGHEPAVGAGGRGPVSVGVREIRPAPPRPHRPGGRINRPGGRIRFGDPAPRPPRPRP